MKQFSLLFEQSSVVMFIQTNSFTEKLFLRL